MSGWSAGDAEADTGASRLGFLREHCFLCHGSADAADEQGGGVRLDDLPAKVGSDALTADRWQKILRVINSGEMPPEEQPRPGPAALESFLESLSLDLVAARRSLADASVKPSMRRLNRREYVNTIRDLLGVVPNATALPADAGVGGYDTTGASLFMSSDQFNDYLAVARSTLGEVRSLRSAAEQAGQRRLVIEPEDATVPRVVARSRRNTLKLEMTAALDADAGLRAPKDYGFTDLPSAEFNVFSFREEFPTMARYLEMPMVQAGAYLTCVHGNPRETIVLPKDWPAGVYRLRINCGATADSPRSQRFIEWGFPEQGNSNSEIVPLGCHEVLGSEQVPQLIETDVMVQPTKSREIAVFQRRPVSGLAEQAHYYSFNGPKGVGPPAAVWIDRLEIEGPQPATMSADPAVVRLLDSDGTESPGEVRGSLAEFAARAFRSRPPRPEFLDQLMEMYADHRNTGAGPADAAIEALAVILASPAFLYLAEPVTENAHVRPLDDQQLAVRLAYFLTSAPPDDELLSIAAARRLHDPNEVALHVDRLIDSPKCDDFVAGFVHQWLDMERLDFFRFDPLLYRDFDDSTKEAARKEVFRFFGQSLRDDRPVTEFLQADWTMVNGLLASYYGFEDVSGDEWRKVSIPENTHRGGLMGMAAILAMGSNGVRSSPVERGAWVLRKLLDRPPPPAPANVPQISRLDGDLLSTRERLVAHQESPQCVHCHKKIDPIGFGMENFDAAGRWRSEESQVVPGKGRKTWPIDASGSLPDGRTFSTFDELRALVASSEESFARTLIANLLEYALGRPLGVADDELVDQLHEQSRREGFGLRRIIHSIVASEAFHSK